MDSPEASFNLANTYAQLGQYEEALAGYEEALKTRPEWIEARQNRDLVHSLVQAAQKDPEEAPPGGDPHFDPDQIDFDKEKAEKGKEGEVQMEKLTDEQMAEMWMRRLETSPAEFLRWRFAAESYAGEEK